MMMMLLLGYDLLLIRLSMMVKMLMSTSEKRRKERASEREGGNCVRKSVRASPEEQCFLERVIKAPVDKCVLRSRQFNIAQMLKSASSTI